MKATSATVGCGGSNAGDNEGPKQENSRPWNATTRTTQQPGRVIGLQKGLSRMRGNSHVRFLEGLGARKGSWPTRRRQLDRAMSTIHSFEDLREVLRNTKPGDRDFFRGEERGDYKLIPKIGRLTRSTPPEECKLIYHVDIVGELKIFQR